MEAWIFYKCSETPVPKGKQGSGCGVHESRALCGGGDRRPRFVDLLGKQTSHVSHPSGTTGGQFAFLFLPGSPISRVSSSNLGIFSLPWTPPSHFVHMDRRVTVHRFQGPDNEYGFPWYIGNSLFTGVSQHHTLYPKERCGLQASCWVSWVFIWATHWGLGGLSMPGCMHLEVPCCTFFIT